MGRRLSSPIDLQIGTPQEHKLRGEPCVLALELIEKPMSFSLSETEYMLQIAKKEGNTKDPGPTQISLAKPPLLSKYFCYNQRRSIPHRHT